MGLAGELEIGEGDVGAVADRDGQEEEQEDQGGGEGEEVGEDAAEGVVVIAGALLVRGLSRARARARVGLRHVRARRLPGCGGHFCVTWLSVADLSSSSYELAALSTDMSPVVTPSIASWMAVETFGYAG